MLLLGISSQNRTCDVVFLVTSLLILTLPILTFLELLSIFFVSSFPFLSIWSVSINVYCNPTLLAFGLLLLDCYSESWLPSGLLAAVLLLSHCSLHHVRAVPVFSFCASSRLSPAQRAVPGVPKPNNQHVNSIFFLFQFQFTFSFILYEFQVCSIVVR